MDDLLTTHEAARMLGIHPFSVARYIDHGVLKGFRTAGGHRRVVAADLRRYLLENDIPVPPELSGGGSKLKLLVVDDEPQVLSALKRAFKPFSSEVALTATTSGVEALLVLGDLVPDALLLDIHMPGLDGFEICERVTQRKSLSGVKVVVMTALHRSDIIGSALRAGAIACLAKPVSPKEVLALIRKPSSEPQRASSGHRRGSRSSVVP
jgi:excisionase family DNA binding protein